jgi:enoyl-[acyl-carrier protein] reductase/trans-2-enoyl-CoA reductase (NAD+)
VFFEKPGTERKTGTAGWYNSAAFDAEAKAAGLYSKSLNGDAFSHEAKAKTIELIKEDLGQIDLVVYSLASPVRKMPDTGEVVRSCLKPIGDSYQSTAIDTNKDVIISAEVEPATQEEIDATVTVMGGEDWELWINALQDAGVLADGCKSVAYSYIGSDITWPIYWDGALGKAKQDLDRAAKAIDTQLKEKGGQGNIGVLKSVVTQASSAIPVMPLYLAMCFKVMREQGLHEGCMEQVQRLFATGLYGSSAQIDDSNRFRMDDWELKDEVQDACREIWPQVTTENLFDLTDYQLYKDEFLKLFGFGISSIDYEADVDTVAEFDVADI